MLTREGAPIRGLYASGVAAEGISGHGAGGYLASDGLFLAFGLAYLAADHVAADARLAEYGDEGLRRRWRFPAVSAGLTELIMGVTKDRYCEIGLF